MSKCHRGDEDGGPQRKLNHKFKIPEDKVSSKGGIKISQCGNRTPAKQKIARIGMHICISSWPEVESCTHKYAVAKVSFEARILGIQRAEVVDVIRVKVGCPGSKTC